MNEYVITIKTTDKNFFDVIRQYLFTHKNVEIHATLARADKTGTISKIDYKPEAN